MEDTAVKKLTAVVLEIKEDLTSMKQDIAGMKTVMATKEDISILKTEIRLVRRDTNDILEMVDFIKDNAITREEFRRTKAH